VTVGHDNHIHEYVTIQGAAAGLEEAPARFTSATQTASWRTATSALVPNRQRCDHRQHSWLPHHVEVEDQVMIGGLCLINPFVRIGRLAMWAFYPTCRFRCRRS
jgi:acyl-[acyl carrier protein]--UDP-N-acetylglucosamine O-acyltransferase